MIGTKINGETYYTTAVEKDKDNAQRIRDRLKKENIGNRVRITGPHYGYYFVRARHISNASLNAQYKANEEERVRKARPRFKTR